MLYSKKTLNFGLLLKKKILDNVIRFTESAITTTENISTKPKSG